MKKKETSGDRACKSVTGNRIMIFLPLLGALDIEAGDNVVHDDLLKWYLLHSSGDGAAADP